MQWLAGSRDAQQQHSDTKKRYHKELLKLPSQDWTLIILFLLSLSGVGLQFYPMALMLIGLLVYAFVHDRYIFLLMVMVASTGKAFISSEVIHVNLSDIVLLASIFGLFFYKKNLLVKKSLCLIALYALYLLAMACLSDERLSIQFFILRDYLSIFAIIIPLWIFADQDFDIQQLYRKTLAFFLVICTFYAIDGLILQGWVLLPARVGDETNISSITNLYWNPLGTWFPRKYPGGMFIIIISAFPLARYYKLKWWQWAIIVLDFASMRTFSVITAFILTLVIFQGKFAKMALYLLIALAGMSILYSVDVSTGGNLRIASSIDQFTGLSAATDEEDLAEFGTGRAGQVIPKWEALVSQNCQWQGFGFLHPTKTTLRRYQIDNSLYVDIEMNDEVVAITEVTQFNTIINIGIIGLILQALFFIGLWYLVRRNPNASFYLSSLLMASIMGVAGFTGLNTNLGLFWISTAFGAVLLTSRHGYKHSAYASPEGTLNTNMIEEHANNNNRES